MATQLHDEVWFLVSRWEVYHGYTKCRRNVCRCSITSCSSKRSTHFSVLCRAVIFELAEKLCQCLSPDPFGTDGHLRRWGIQICQYPHLTRRLVVLLLLPEVPWWKWKLTRKIVRAVSFFAWTLWYFLVLRSSTYGSIFFVLRTFYTCRSFCHTVKATYTLRDEHIL